MIALSEFKIIRKTENDFEELFEIGPLPQGYGHTLGNILRRVLSSSIPGAAVTSVKIDGVQHEYSTLEGVKDDMLSVVLSMKNIAIRMKTEEPVTLSLKVKGKKGSVVEVKASDIEKNSDVEIINGDYVITTLTDGAEIDAEMVVERGVGYKLPNEEVRKELGMLPVDAFFSPVNQVKYEVVPTRVGQQTELDQVNLTVKTDGTITPSDALSIASKIINDMANNFVEQTKDMISGKAIQSVPTEEAAPAKPEEEEGTEDEKKSLPVADLNLSTRLTNALLRSGFDDLTKLEGFTEEEVANIRGMGEKSLVELMEVLKKYDIKLI